MASKRFARLSNGFSKKIDCRLAAISLHVTFYNLFGTPEALRMTPAMALGLTDRVWAVADLIEASLKAMPPTPTPTERRRQFHVIQGDLFNQEPERPILCTGGIARLFMPVLVAATV